MTKYLVKNFEKNGGIFDSLDDARKSAIKLAKEIAWNLEVDFPGCYDPDRVELYEYSLADDEMVDGTVLAIAKDRTDDADEPWPVIVIVDSQETNSV